MQERVTRDVIARETIERLESLRRERIGWADAIVSPFHTTRTVGSRRSRPERTPNEGASRVA
jgi:hypothetical protein